MKMMLLSPYADAYLVDIEDTPSLDALQALVGGWIERVATRDESLDAWANEEGAYQVATLDDGRRVSWPLNVLAHSVTGCGPVLGNVVLTGGGDQGITKGLDAKQIAKLRRSGLMWADADYEVYGEWDLPSLLKRLAVDGMVRPLAVVE